MVMTFWVPSLTGSSSWAAFRSADPSSQPISNFQAHAIGQHQHGKVIRKPQYRAHLVRDVVSRRHVELHWDAHDEAVAGLQCKPLDFGDLRKVHAPHPVSSDTPAMPPAPAISAAPAPTAKPNPIGSKTTAAAIPVT